MSREQGDVIREQGDVTQEKVKVSREQRKVSLEFLEAVARIFRDMEDK